MEQIHNFSEIMVGITEGACPTRCSAALHSRRGTKGNELASSNARGVPVRDEEGNRAGWCHDNECDDEDEPGGDVVIGTGGHRNGNGGKGGSQSNEGVSI